MQRPFLFLLVLFFATSTSALDRDVHNLNGYQHLTRKLGDDSYLVRERAEQKLLRLGLDAFVELQQAKEDADAEIARRAEGILSRLEQLSVGRENEAVRYWVTAYSLQSDPVEKGAIIWLLCNPLSDFRAGEGLSTLCRIARFDENRALRAEAVKALIASPPVAQKMQRKWYRSIRDTIHDPGDDELLQLLSLFVELRCIFDERREEVDASLQKRVLDLTDRMAEFQTDPKNNGIRAGNRNDILLFYALAMLQDRAGLAAERDRAVAAAAMVQTEEPTKTTDGDTIELGASKPFYDHLHVSRILRSQYRLAWAKQHFDLVIGHGDILFKIDACHLAAEASLFQKKFDAAVSYFDKAAELAGSEPFKARQSNSAELVRRFQVGRFLVLAHQAAAENDWQKVEEHVVAGLNMDPFEIDLLIFAWQCRQRNSGPADHAAFRDFNQKIDNALRHIEQQIYREGNTELRYAKAVDACNQAAWLLANTGGGYTDALNLIEEALKEEPESVAYLDTLAHVYFLGKQYDKAIETQEKVVRMAPEAAIFRDTLQRFRSR